MLVAVTWSHPDAKLQLQIAPPGKGSVFQGASVSGGEVGIEAQRYPQTQPGEWQIRVIKPSMALGAGEYKGELMVLLHAGTAEETILRQPISVSAGFSSVKEFSLRGSALTPIPTK